MSGTTLGEIVGNYRYIDLSQSIQEGIPVWPGDQPYSLGKLSRKDKKTLLMAQGCGTHIDAPVHFHKHGLDIASIPLKELIAPACVLDIREKVKDNADYMVNKYDIIDWENQYGQISENSIFLVHTGWAKFWNKKEQYLNFDNSNTMHFPGFSVNALEYLIAKNVNGLGIDTLSVDPGFSTDFPVHELMSSYGGFHIENLCNLESLPAVGAMIVALPLKLCYAEESPARVIAFLTNQEKSNEDSYHNA